MQLIKYKRWRLLSVIDQGKSRQLFDLIESRQFQVTKRLKQNHRSDVLAFLLDGKELVLKVPKEKNQRPWIRFTTLYRKAEAFKNLESIQLLKDLGIPSNQPILAAEKRKFGVVIYSWVVFSYIEGKSCLNQEHAFPKVIDTLNKLHSKGYRHGDPQIRNFILGDDIVFAIDANPTKPLFPFYSFPYEFAYLVRSQPGIEKYLSNKESPLYKLTRFIDLKSRRVAHYRKKIKSFFRMLFPF